MESVLGNTRNQSCVLVREGCPIREITILSLAHIIVNYSLYKISILSFKMYGYTHLHLFFRHIFKGSQFSFLPLCLPGERSLLKMGSTLKGMNLLQLEQILFFMR